MVKKLVIKSLKQTCFAAPEQYEGVLDDGRIIYIRERHRRFRVGLGATLEEAILAEPYIFGTDQEMKDMVLEHFILPDVIEDCSYSVFSNRG